MLEFDEDLYDTIIAIESCIAITMNISAFIWMHIQPKQKSKEFTRISFPLIGSANRGLCTYGGTMLCTYMTTTALTSIHYIIFPICIAYLLRFNVFVRKKHKYYRANWEKVLHFYLWGILPVVFVPTSYLYLIPDEDIRQFKGLTLEIYDKYTSDGFILVLFDANSLRLSSLALWVNVFSELTFLVCAIFYYYIPLELALRKAMKESRFDTARIIKSNIVKLRVIIVIPAVLAVTPLMITMGMAMLFTDNLLRYCLALMRYLSLPLVLIFFMASSINSVYQSYNFKKRKTPIVRKNKISSTPDRFNHVKKSNI
uniref:G_PROTEIN_RECEP_F1_2 domain-containing protein n=1 Tax=Rhabditophanes sp. KR3021 TaxID=114890 RepID=A0AC35TX38_9BILA